MKIKLGYNFEWIKVYFSPFKFFLPRFYIGETKIGAPYFLPRNMKLNKETKYYEFTKKKVGFSFCGMGWKTKWTSTDFRHEWNPVWSFVFFGYQIALIFRPKHDVHFWECWLYYNYATDKKKTVKERLKQAREEFPCTWTSHSNGEDKKVCYWDIIIKNKYIN